MKGIDIVQHWLHVCLSVHDLLPGQVVHAELLVKLVELLDVLPELEAVAGEDLGLCVGRSLARSDIRLLFSTFQLKDQRIH